MTQRFEIIKPEKAAQLAEDLFGIKGSATPLPGDTDQNFQISSEGSICGILKISRPETALSKLNFQHDLLHYLKKVALKISSPEPISDLKGNLISEIEDSEGLKRAVRMLSWVPGRMWSAENYISEHLKYQLGESCGKIALALTGFHHPNAERILTWDIAQYEWLKNVQVEFSEEDKALIDSSISDFDAIQEVYTDLRKSVIHNDANDNNILLSGQGAETHVIGLIDYGDAIETQLINELAIACSYAIMNAENPLLATLPIIRGFNEVINLSEEELSVLYHCIAMRLVISVVHSSKAMIEEPENKYLQVSSEPAWALLRKWRKISTEFAEYAFRSACKLPIQRIEKTFNEWAKANTKELMVLFPETDFNGLHATDFSVSSSWLGHFSEIQDLDVLEFKVNQLQKRYPTKILSGGYLEPRTLYTSEAYRRLGNTGYENRSIHLGVDFWLPAGTAFHSPFEGEIVTASFNNNDKDYGGLIILRHDLDDFSFYSLYGHLSQDSIVGKKPGMEIAEGARVGELGRREENGNWVPHLHFQIMLSMLDFEDDFPGVAFPSEKEIWKGICPDPMILFKEELEPEDQEGIEEDLLDFRRQHLGKSLSLQYQQPLHIVRGSGARLIDASGRKYLDTVNNVAHVGHEHLAVVQAGQQQMALLNTNTRYLHKNINELAEELLRTLPPQLSVLHFVNSGSEANELALRMMKAATGRRDIIVSEVGYHGNTNATVDISSYKFDGKGGSGAPPHTWVLPLPDSFRGKYRGEETGKQYAKEVGLLVKEIGNAGRQVGGIILESIISCGGQIELPEGFLKSAYEQIRAAGGICIADEVQTGLGRVGKKYWAFELHNVVPDIVTMGKPLGNGHPIGAVACTPEVAEKFANGMEYFNTFGGNPVSCAIGKEVLKVVREEGLQEKALETGEYLKEGLRELADKNPIIRDVRGQGLFLGIELTDESYQPLPIEAGIIINRMKDHGILMSTDGPDNNVIKIKPPMVFGKAEADEVLRGLAMVW